MSLLLHAARSQSEGNEQGTAQGRRITKGEDMKLTKQMVKYDFFYDRILEMENEKSRIRKTDNDLLLNNLFGDDAETFINEARKMCDFESAVFADC